MTKTRNSDKINSAAIVTLKSPGKFTKRGARKIADWLRRQADDLEALHSKYTTGRFTARWIWS
jgi:hypothetical protein